MGTNGADQRPPQGALALAVIYSQVTGEAAFRIIMRNPSGYNSGGAPRQLS